MARRERLFGIAEKLPKRNGSAFARRKVVAIASARAAKRR
jgi:hypothetical protein